MMSAVTGVRRKTSTPTASAMALMTAPKPAPTGGSPTPLAPTGVSGSGIPRAAHCVDVVRHLMAVVPPSQLDRAFRGVRVAHSARRVAAGEPPPAGEPLGLQRTARDPRPHRPLRPF